MKFNKTSHVDGTAKCGICVGRRGVHVAIFEIATADKAVLDRIEGLGKGYNEYSFQDSRFGRCFTYVADPFAIDDSLKPTDWYKEIVLLGCRSNNFPSEHILAIESIDAIQDPDERRSREHWMLVEELRNFRA
ncbi:MAG: hypothetical protein KJO31_09310 [Gammaproteobacteria bacterium]|nr:hypothetical protein [Gammaproteobacteria bacterium]